MIKIEIGTKYLIPINSEEESKKIQDYLFSIGCLWPFYNKNYRYLDAKYLCIGWGNPRELGFTYGEEWALYKINNGEATYVVIKDLLE